MARKILWLVLLVWLIAGCTLLRGEPDATPPVVTATLPEPLQTLAAEAQAAPTQTAEAQRLASRTPSATDTPTPSPTVAATATDTPRPSATPSITSTATLRPPPSPVPPTRTIPGPTSAPPLDDGSGGIVPGTGGLFGASSPVAGIEGLPEVLYYLSDDGAQPQVWRLRVGINYPDQMTFSPDGVIAFDVAYDGTLAYITPAGHLIAAGVPVTPPTLPDGSLPPVTSLAWSADGSWLAYVVQSSAPEDGEHPVDGLWLRDAVGNNRRVAASVYGGDAPQEISGPLRWQPGASRLLAGYTDGAGAALALVDAAAASWEPAWQGNTPGPVDVAWLPDGSAAIISDRARILRLAPDGSNAATVFEPAGAVAPRLAQPLVSGGFGFVGVAGNGGLSVYRLPPGQDAPTALMPPVTVNSALEVAWDGTGREALVVVHQPAEAPLGTGYWLDASRVMHDLTPLTGRISSPRWGPRFQAGDTALVRTPTNAPLNVRNAPNGEIVAGLVAGSQVRIVNGPFDAASYRWWQVRALDGRTGWVVQSVPEENGGRFVTLQPAG